MSATPCVRSRPATRGQLVEWLSDWAATFRHCPACEFESGLPTDDSEPVGEFKHGAGCPLEMLLTTSPEARANGEATQSTVARASVDSGEGWGAACSQGRHARTGKPRNLIQQWLPYMTQLWAADPPWAIYVGAFLGERDE